MWDSSRPAPGLGIDVVDIDRVARLLARRPAFGERYFGAEERRLPVQRHAPWYAMCLAAKEAFVKALGIGVLDIPLRELQLVVTDGRASFECGPEAQRALAVRGFGSVRVTIARDHERAMAWVVLGPSTSM